MTLALRILIILIVLSIIPSCQTQNDIEAEFNTVDLKNYNGRKAIRIKLTNRSNTNYFLLNPVTIEKKDGIHPCPGIMLSTYTKASSHQKGDCQVNHGIRLFEYIRTTPFNKSKHTELRRLVLERNDDLDMMFDYLNPMMQELGWSPNVTFVAANSSTYAYFAIADTLGDIDRGIYKIDWLPKHQLDKTISRNHPRRSVKFAIRVNVDEYRYYDHEVNAIPIFIKL